MDGNDHARLTDSPELLAGSLPGHSFGRRLRRAVLTLGAAIAAHVWLVNSRPADSLAARFPLALSSAVSMSGLGVAPAVAARQPQTAARRSVQVRAEFIKVPVAFEWDNRPPAPEQAVATSGVVRASLDAAPETSDHHPTSVPALPVVHPVPIPDAMARRPISNEASEHARDREILALVTAVPSVSAAPLVVPEKAPGSAPSVTDRAAELRKQEEIVRGVLRDYTRAFEHLDVQAAKAIWPSVDDRALRRAFQQLDGQQLRFASCGVSVSDRDANARCQGDATYRPKVGSRVLRLTQREWTFSLARDNDRWQIVNATLQ
jgi:hypothetical protein